MSYVLNLLLRLHFQTISIIFASHSTKKCGNFSLFNGIHCAATLPLPRKYNMVQCPIDYFNSLNLNFYLCNTLFMVHGACTIEYIFTICPFTVVVAGRFCYFANKHCRLQAMIRPCLLLKQGTKVDSFLRNYQHCKREKHIGHIIVHELITFINLHLFFSAMELPGAQMLQVTR